MPNICIVCSAVATPDFQLQYCSACKSALYCSKVCQAKDWKKQHKKICKLLNVGHGDMQVQTVHHTRLYIYRKMAFERGQRSLDEDGKRFFKLFEESTFEGSQASAQMMEKIAKRQTKETQKYLLFLSLNVLIRSDSMMLSWPNSPLLVLLQFVDLNMLSGDALQEGGTIRTPLHDVADMAAPRDYLTHENQLILAKQLIEHGANVNAVSSSGQTPLHCACHAAVVTNLDVVEYLLEAGADPNVQDCLGETPLMCTTPDSPGAAKFLLNWPTRTDVNITMRSGESFLALVRLTVKHFSGKVAGPANPDRVEHRFLLQQWCEIEEMLVERGAAA
jgi:hypothetical protein